MDDPNAAQAVVDTADGEVFDKAYYATHCGSMPYDHSCGFWAEFFGRIADELIRAFRPRRVFDAGCAHGFLVEAFWDRGVEAWGRDISRHANSDVRRDLRQYCAVGSIADPIEGEYDLITCIEVLEHMPEAEAIQAVAAMTSATNRILFSSSPSDLEEPTHVNVHPAIYWLRLFGANGFTPDMTYDATFILPHTLVLVRAEGGVKEQDLITCAALVRTRLVLTEREKVIRELEAERGRLNHELTIERARVEHELVIARAQFTYDTDIERAQIRHELEIERVRVQQEIEAKQAQANAEIEAERGGMSGRLAAERALSDRDIELQQAQANHDQAALIQALCDLEDERARGIAKLDAEHNAEQAALVAQSVSVHEAEWDQRVAAAEAKYQAVVTSTVWVSTSPLRAMGGWISRPTRRRLMRALGFLRRGVTPQNG